MAYIPPSDLGNITQELIKQYSGINPWRWSVIALYEQIENDADPKKQESLLVGLGVFILGSIKYGEYNGSSPKLGWLGGSSFYTVFKKLFNIHKKNPLCREEQLFYLHELKKFINNDWPDIAFEKLARHDILKNRQKKLVWASKKELSEEVSKTFNAIFKKNEEGLHQIIHGLPVKSRLITCMKAIEKEHQTNSNNTSNPQRLYQINCLRFIIETSEQEKFTCNSHVCAAVLVHLAMDIKKEYEYYEWLGWSAENSTMFREILKVLNKKSLNEILLEEKLLWFKDLQAHFLVVSAHPDYKKTLEKLAAATTGLTMEALEAQIKNFQQAVTSRLKVFETEKSTPSYTSQLIAKTTSYGVQWGLNKVGAELTMRVIVGGLSLGGFLAAGPVGYAMFGTAGTMLMSGLGYLLSDNLVETASAKLFAFVIAKIGDAVGDAAAKATCLSYSVTPAGLEDMRKELGEDDIVFVRWVNTLLDLDTVSPEDKQHMRAVLNLNENENLRPVFLNVKGAETFGLPKQYAC